MELESFLINTESGFKIVGSSNHGGVVYNGINSWKRKYNLIFPVYKFKAS